MNLSDKNRKTICKCVAIGVRRESHNSMATEQQRKMHFDVYFPFDALQCLSFHICDDEITSFSHENSYFSSFFFLFILWISLFGLIIFVFRRRWDEFNCKKWSKKKSEKFAFEMVVLVRIFIAFSFSFARSFAHEY